MRRLWPLLLVVLALGACGGADEPAPPSAAQASGVKELANILDLRSDFEADAEKTRVIILFSPT